MCFFIAAYALAVTILLVMSLVAHTQTKPLETAWTHGFQAGQKIPDKSIYQAGYRAGIRDAQRPITTPAPPKKQKKRTATPTPTTEPEPAPTAPEPTPTPVTQPEVKQTPPHPQPPPEPEPMSEVSEVVAVEVVSQALVVPPRQAPIIIYPHDWERKPR